MTLTTTRTAAPVEVVTPIKPSEAIRLGCLRSLPTAGEWYDWDDDGRLHACALGAAMLGWGDDPNIKVTP